MLVKGCKDVTGQEFVGEIISETQTTITIKNPIVFVPTENGVVPIPYVMTSKGNFDISKEKLICGPYSVMSNIEEAYRKMHGGIIEPSKELIL